MMSIVLFVLKLFANSTISGWIFEKLVITVKNKYLLGFNLVALRFMWIGICSFNRIFLCKMRLKTTTAFLTHFYKGYGRDSQCYKLLTPIRDNEYYRSFVCSPSET